MHIYTYIYIDRYTDIYIYTYIKGLIHERQFDGGPESPGGALEAPGPDPRLKLGLLRTGPAILAV